MKIKFPFCSGLFFFSFSLFLAAGIVPRSEAAPPLPPQDALGPVNCAALTDQPAKPRWLSLPLSRLVVNPTYDYAQHPMSQFMGDVLTTDLAYYVGAAPARLPAFLSWQLITSSAAAQRQSVSLTPADWQTSAVVADFEGGRARLASTGNYGNISRTVTVDLDRTPALLVQVLTTQGQWAVKVHDDSGGATLISDNGQTGAYLVNLPAKTGWHGTKTFTLELWAIGGPDHSTTVSSLQFIASLGEAAPRQYLWAPHEVGVSGSAEHGEVSAETTTGLADENTVVQRLRVVKTKTGALRLTGQFTDGRIQWDAARQALMLQGNGYHALLAFSRPVRRLETTSGLWAVDFNSLKAEDQIIVATRFVPTSQSSASELASVRAQASPAAFAAALRRGEAAWNRRLATVPRPLDFTPRAVDAKGITARDVRRSYYRAWVFFLQNTLPPMPENGFPYPQVCVGKPSLWTDGAPHSESSGLWDGVVALQALALVDPQIGWAAAQGIMTQVDVDGYIGGEALPAIYAQTFWLLFQQTGDLDRLRHVYPALKRFLLWKITHPRWIYPNKSLNDVKPSTLKDNEFVVHEIVDIGYAIKIANALKMPDEAAFWQTQRQQAAADYLHWFLPPPGDTLYRIYTSETNRGAPNETWSIKGLQIDPDLLPQQARDTMLAVFHQHFNTDTPFGIRENRFGDLEPITLGLFQSGQVADAERMADLALRDVTRAGDFSEDYTRTDPPVPNGVRPSAFGARLMIDSVLWHNGVVLDQGFPVLLGMPNAAGVDNIPVQGSRLCVRFDQTGHTVTLRGLGLARLRLPDRFHATTTGGERMWVGPISEGQQIPLEPNK